jgi:hypothetical protein
VAANARPPQWAGIRARDRLEALHSLSAEPMKRILTRIGTWAVYVIGTLAIIYLALFAYAVFTRQEFVPGDPIHIFRNPEAPNYS